MPSKERWAQMSPEEKRRQGESKRLSRERKRQQDPEWAERERERYRQRHQRRMQSNPDQVRQWRRTASAKQYAKNGDKRRAQRRDYRRRNPGLEAERDRRYRSTEEYKERARETAKAYRRKHPELARLYQWRKRGSRSDARTWAEILLGDPCCFCGDPVEEIDHIVPIINGGDGEWTNLTAACLPCNRSKGSRRLLLWLATTRAA